LAPLALVLILAAGAVGWLSARGQDQAVGAADADRAASASRPATAGAAARSPDSSPPGQPARSGPSPRPSLPPPSPSAPNPADPADPADPTASGSAAPDRPDGELAGRVVALDPGHSPAGASSAQVPDGRGGTKNCNTSGTATDDGYPEHAFNYDVAVRVRAWLEARGATVHLSRGDDPAAGPTCVDRRGAFAQDSGAELLVSIHADGNADRSVKGFFAIVSSPPLNQAQGQPSLDLAEAVLERLRAAGFTQNAAYPGGISKRSDIAGVSLSTKPVVMFELGEMRNPDEAAQMASPEGRQRYAEAVAAGIADWLASHL
jgi:N-acetylmuramoyl-L-alanine amidase